MPISLATYAPWGNAQLTFQVSNSRITTDPSTGNPVAGFESLTYLAAFRLARPSWQSQEGVDMTTYQCTGRLLYPTVLDERITNGSQALATVNGYRGRFELVFDLDMDEAAYRTLRQSIQGLFRVIGGKQTRNQRA